MNDLIINVYGFTEDGRKIYPSRISKERDKKALDLLMIENGEAYHYVLIKSLNRLLGKSGAVAHPKDFCPYCYYGFENELQMMNKWKNTRLNVLQMEGQR